ncbi:filamentous hemagglutinin N-terminal domain-containing protein [Lysobacter arvi]|nr:filamentous hemagglutinin N-terminal domain-containing protein [Lysobacter arvi]
MVVDWKNFDVARNQTVNFQQPGATSAVLNRVSGSGKATEILGSINANGRVFVVNPDGVMFGRTAKVNVGSLVASSLNASSQEFMEGGRAYSGEAGSGATNAPRYLSLQGGQGTVRNEGRLNASGTVVLAGPQVANTGTIRATAVTLQAGDGVAVRMDGSNLSAVLTRGRMDALVQNGGVISANGGDIELSAAATGDLVRDVVRNTGVLEAVQATTGAGGRIELLAPISGAMSIGGKVTGASVKADASPWSYGGFAGPELEYEQDVATTGHDIRVEKFAQVKSVEAIALATDNDLTVNGRIDGGSVWLQGDDVTTQGRIHGASNVNIDARGKLAQNGDIIADTAHVLLRAHDIQQANGTMTRAGDYIRLDAKEAAGGTVRTAGLQGKTVYVRGHDIQLDGRVRASGNVHVEAVEKNECMDTCIAAVRPGGSIVQNGSVTSTTGDVTFTGYTITEYPDVTSISQSGSLVQSATSQTRAAGKVTVGTRRAEVGNIQAGQAIVVTSPSTTLIGRLAAPEITLPPGALNIDGNVRIKR